MYIPGVHILQTFRLIMIWMGNVLKSTVHLIEKITSSNLIMKTWDVCILNQFFNVRIDTLPILLTEMENSSAKLSELKVKTSRKDAKSNDFQIKTCSTLEQSTLPLTCYLTNSLSTGNPGGNHDFSGENTWAASLQVRGFCSADELTHHVTSGIKIDFRLANDVIRSCGLGQVACLKRYCQRPIPCNGFNTALLPRFQSESEILRTISLK
jgi:hypothetical protein